METTWFTKSLKSFFSSDQDYADFQDYLSEQPEKGDVIEGSGGLRKIRWADKERGQGKRGGCRIPYLHIPDYGRFLLIDIYRKNQQDNFSPEDLKDFRRLIQDYRHTLARIERLNR